jgi:hypothetical protein
MSAADLTAGRLPGNVRSMPEGQRHVMDRCWRKSRIAARILLRHQAGRATARDERLARILSADNGVTSRLIDQAIYGIRGRANRLANERRQAA